MVRPGAAPEMGTADRRYPVMSARFDANAGGTAEGLPFVPILGMEGFFITQNLY